jgi:hypothetical protein
MRAPWRTERIDGASHFLMLDQPDLVIRLILEFSRKRLENVLDEPCLSRPFGKR